MNLSPSSLTNYLTRFSDINSRFCHASPHNQCVFVTSAAGYLGVISYEDAKTYGLLRRQNPRCHPV